MNLRSHPPLSCTPCCSEGAKACRRLLQSKRYLQPLLVTAEGDGPAWTRRTVSSSPPPHNAGTVTLDADCFILGLRTINGGFPQFVNTASTRVLIGYIECLSGQVFLCSRGLILIKELEEKPDVTYKVLHRIADFGKQVLPSGSSLALLSTPLVNSHLLPISSFSPSAFQPFPPVPLYHVDLFASLFCECFFLRPLFLLFNSIYPHILINLENQSEDPSGFCTLPNRIRTKLRVT